MRKVYRKLTVDQKERGVVFSSCLSAHTTEMPDDRIHEVYTTDEDLEDRITRLLDDSFFNASPGYKYNIVRRGN